MAIFNPSGWHPIDWAVVDKENREVTFNKVPKNAVYNTVSYSKGKATPISTAFYLSSKGEVIYIKPNSKNLTNIKVFEKYPPKERLFDFRKDKVNSVFQCANNRGIKDAEGLYSFKDIPSNYIESIKVENEKKVRYVRFKPQGNVLSNIAIMEFYEKTKKV